MSVPTARPAAREDAGVPAAVQALARRHGTEISDLAWTRLSPLEHYALCKLTRSREGDHVFARARADFGIDREAGPVGFTPPASSPARTRS